MASRYESFSYRFPPRPETPVMDRMLDSFISKGWVAQVKMDGTCSVIAVAPDRTLRAMTRHNDVHKKWAPDAITTAPYANLPGTGWYVFVAELLHSRIPTGPKNTNFIHDVLVADGDELVGETYAKRLLRLESIFLKADSVEDFSHFKVDSNTWVAKTFTKDFKKLFDSLYLPEHEGVVLKDPTAKLNRCTREKSNSDWQVKCRRPTKQHAF